MKFIGTWLTESESMLYRVMPKAACSTIGQIMYYSDNGVFYDGDIHDATTGMYKWPDHGADVIADNAVARRSYTFSSVRNPYTRILSSYLDKICGIQRTGNRYRGNLVPLLKLKYGVEYEGEFDQIASFRRFLLFARDTIWFNKPIWPDIHWNPMFDHMTTLVRPGGRIQHIVYTEKFNEGMQVVLDNAPLKHSVDLAKVPRFNESEGHGPKRLHPVEDYFDDLSMHLMWEMYRRDFELFRYDFDNPGNKMPIGEIDYDELHVRLMDPHKPHWMP
jgi:hypothetical protein